MNKSADSFKELIEEEKILSCFDAINNSISIYKGKDAKLVYGNYSYCRYLHVETLDDLIGLPFAEIIEKIGISMKPIDSDLFKMYEVLEKGKEAIDWEVAVEAKDSPGKVEIVSNDMYPVKAENGEVLGMIEISRSKRFDRKRVSKIAGLSADYNFENIIGESQALRDCVRMAKEFAKSPYNILIAGESGVGKEMFSQSIHNYSSRVRGPFVAINCGSFPENLIESELFGYVAGAFTGASKNGQVGKFELAEGGTLFLDEIGELPYNCQAKLLRVIENRVVTRIGGNREIPVNFRIIAASNRNLSKMVSERLFRQDLYYRLQVLCLNVPPLRERSDDVIILAETFLKQAMGPDDVAPKELSSTAKKVLTSYDWPGNIRELRNAINRIHIISRSRVITGEMIEETLSSDGYMLNNATKGKARGSIESIRNEIDSLYGDLLLEAIRQCGGNKSKAADLLEISRKTFYRMSDKYL